MVKNYSRDLLKKFTAAVGLTGEKEVIKMYLSHKSRLTLKIFMDLVEME